MSALGGSAPPRPTAGYTPDVAKSLGNCTQCGIHAEVDDVTIVRIVGLIVVFQWRRVGGRWCRRCVDRELFADTLLSAVMGWWGVISFFLTPFFLAVNAWTFLKTRGLAPPAG